MWDPKRKSHQGLLDAGYRGPWQNDPEHAAECKFCNRAIVWYVTPKDKMQPFTASSYEPHHGDCAAYAAARKLQKTQHPTFRRQKSASPATKKQRVLNQ